MSVDVESDGRRANGSAAASAEETLTVGSSNGTTALSAVVFSPIASVGLTPQAVHRLSEAIRAGLLAEGERLPPEAELSEQFGISAMTLREALAELRELGYLETRRGRNGGTFVKHPPEPSELDRKELSGAFEAKYFLDLADYRRAVTSYASGLAAERATPQDVDRISRSVDACEQAISRREYLRQASLLHITIAAATRSDRILREQTAVEMEANGALLATAAVQHRRDVEVLFDDHTALLTAIREQNRRRARLIASSHIDRTSKIFSDPGAAAKRTGSDSDDGWAMLAAAPATEGSGLIASDGDDVDIAGWPVIREVIFAPIGGEGLAHQTVRRLADGIKIGLLKPGERLPRESQLSEMLGISPLTLREALATLRQSGLLETRRGRGGGTFVKQTRAWPSVGEARKRLKSLTPRFLIDYTDFRNAIAGEATALAAERASTEELLQIEKLAATMSESQALPSYRQLDAAFHVQIATASRSSRLAASEAKLQIEFGEIVHALSLLFPKDRRPLLAASNNEHQMITDAIRRRDPEGARAAAVAHGSRTCELLISFYT
ncbi:FadR/GntR family transcriptional regulator [Nocardia pseudovaccinii]|uniref:FadR/GntR family transcriptional regulator n=1 Tax=Nocardia pseudovaccinii TaxID=189540 RepID=UPI003D93434F